MNNIDSSFQSTTVGQRFSFAADIDFMQYGIRDLGQGLAETLLRHSYNGANNYILRGCVVSSSAGTTTITSGYIIGVSAAYGGMAARTYIYYHAGSSFPDPSGGDVIVGKVNGYVQAYADPTPYTDGSTHDVHKEFRIDFTAGASGSGDFDYSTLVNTYTPWTKFDVSMVNPDWWGTFFGVQIVPSYRRDLITNTGGITWSVMNNTPGGAPSATILTLPVGFRPAANLTFGAWSLDLGTLNFIPITLSLGTSGVLSFADTTSLPTVAGNYIRFPELNYFLA